jgi:hypothetical protein
VKDAMVNIGPVSVPGVPVTEFSKIPGSRETWAALWRIVGPSAQRNLARNPPVDRHRCRLLRRTASWRLTCC